jgi:hypothetical protein
MQGSHRRPAAMDRNAPERRVRDLGRLLPLGPEEIADESPRARRRVLALLRRALRAQRCRGLAGHWSYDLARHAQLLAAYRAEVAAEGARN